MKRRNFIFSLLGFFGAKKIAENLAATQPTLQASDIDRIKIIGQGHVHERQQYSLHWTPGSMQMLEWYKPI